MHDVPLPKSHIPSFPAPCFDCGHPPDTTHTVRIAPLAPIAFLAPVQLARTVLTRRHTAHLRHLPYHRLLSIAPTEHDLRTARIGFAYGFSAFMWWGVVMTLYLAAIHASPTEQLMQRICFGLPSILLLIALSGRFHDLINAMRNPRVMLLLVASTVLIVLNWSAFIYAVSENRLMDASLGYYATPLVSIALGVLFLGERLRKLEWTGIVLAIASVSLAAWERQAMPWISITLMFAFAGYGLIRKRVDAGPLVGLTIEFLIAFPFALAWYIWHLSIGGTAIAYAPPLQIVLMALAGFVVIAPLACFSAAARRLRLASLGILQYISPTAQMIIGLIKGEPVSATRLIAFVLIWAALLCYSYNSIQRSRRITKS